jgi:hypothetical protein
MKKEYWKITELKKCLTLLSRGDKLEIDEKYYTEKKINLMKEAQEFGFQLGKSQSQKDILEMIEGWDVEPCCHGIPQDKLISKIKEMK